MTKLTGNGKTKLDVTIKKDIPADLMDEVYRALRSVKGWGSIEIYVQNHSVTQITTRNIKKTRHALLGS